MAIRKESLLSMRCLELLVGVIHLGGKDEVYFMIKEFFALFKKKEFSGQPYSEGAAGYGESYNTGPNVYSDISDAYNLHPWVYAAVYAIASKVASIDILAYLPDDEKLELEKNHPFVSLLRRPNFYMSGNQLKFLRQVSLEMTGRAFWKIERDARGQPIEIWPMPPQFVRPVGTKQKFIDHFVYCPNGRDIVYPYEDVIYFQDPNPKDMLIGLGAAQAAITDITTDMFARQWNKNFFQHSGRPDSILETEQKLSDEVRKRTIKAWLGIHKGLKNSHGVALLDSGVKYREVNRNRQDMDFVSQQKMAREAVLGVFGVPPAIVSLLEYANYANMDPQIKIFWDMNIIPKLNAFCEILTLRAEQITYRKGSVFRPDLRNVEILKPNFLTMSQAARNFTDMGVPLNDVIKKLGLPFEMVEGGDESRPANISSDFTDDLSSGEPDQNGSPKSLKKKSSDELARIEVWKGYDSRVRKKEKQFLNKARDFFTEQKQRVLEKFEKNSAEFVSEVEKSFGQKANAGTIKISLIFDEEEEQKKLSEKVSKTIEETFKDFAVSTARTVKPGFNFDLDDPRAIDFINSKRMKISREINQTTKESLSKKIVDAVSEAVREGYSKSETVAQIRDRIEEVYQFAQEGRAQRIAQTETISASNAGSFEGMRQTGVQKKEWLSSRDDKTRETHINVDGQVVDIGGKFEVGGSTLSFPGDPEGPPDEIINCRCTLIPVVED